MYKEKFSNYHLYGERSKPIPSDFIHVQSFDSLIDLYDGQIKPHLHTLLVHVLVIKEGKVIITLSKKEVEVTGPCLVLIPANIVHGFLYDKTKGWAFTISSNYIEDILKPIPTFQMKFNKLHIIPGAAGNVNFKHLSLIADNIAKELSSNLAGKSLILQSGFAILIVESLRTLYQQENISITQENRKLKYYQDFQNLIKESLLTDNRNIAQYAKELGVTTIHLNRICQSVAGKSALHVVQDYLIQGALNYLNNTDYSVSEISYILKVKDPFYFSRLFKKHIGVSPKVYGKNPNNSKFEG
ncbi:MAG: AraC family transcriptional regulator [Bacteroidota bacterium]|nr:AraC family transcriptional regulator [Bacteroidota bacterium]